MSPTEGVFRVELGGRVSGSHLYTNMKLMELRKNGNVLKNGGVLRYTDKKDNEIFLIVIFKEIQKGSVAKSYMTNGLFIFG